MRYAVLGAVAQFERDLMRERTITGIQAAKNQGEHIFMVILGPGIRSGSEHICLVALLLTRRRIPLWKRMLAGKTGTNAQ
jgi:hypothetical protein